MVGEIRDVETAQIAIQSALTGHLVFTTVHANNVVDVLGRFLNMGVDPYNFVSALNCIMAQRLVRVICGNCKKPVHYADQLLTESGIKPDQYREFTFYEGAGCLECNGTGNRDVRTTIGCSHDFILRCQYPKYRIGTIECEAAFDPGRVFWK